jgi:hypothetical protein
MSDNPYQKMKNAARSWVHTLKDTWHLFLILVCEAIGTAATPGLLCQPRVILKVIVQKQIECILAGETEVLGENLPQRHFCPSQNPTWPNPVLNPDCRGGKPATNRLSYGAAPLGMSDQVGLQQEDFQTVLRAAGGTETTQYPRLASAGWRRP